MSLNETLGWAMARAADKVLDAWADKEPCMFFDTDGGRLPCPFYEQALEMLAGPARDFWGACEWVDACDPAEDIGEAEQASACLDDAAQRLDQAIDDLVYGEV